MRIGALMKEQDKEIVEGNIPIVLQHVLIVIQSAVGVLVHQLQVVTHAHPEII